MQKILRQTSETHISLILDMQRKAVPRITIPIPFFAHLLTSMSWHGGFYLEVKADGDVDIDPHHLVEDMGIVLGQALAAYFDESALVRYGAQRIVMDDALSEVIVDACKRPYVVYTASYPQNFCGTFDLALLREFFHALAYNAGITIHLHCHYGENSHHMAEALFKALGRSLAQAFTRIDGKQSDMSTKGKL